MQIFSNPWVIGIGITVIGGLILWLILYFIFGVGKSKHTTVAPSSAPNTKNSVTPEEIIQTLDKTPPYQRNDAAKNYIGLEVFWLVEFKSITTLNGMQLIAMPPNEYGPVIICPIDIEHYPQFKIMKSGENITIEGTIAEVKYSEIYLRDCNIHFTE